jgi:hypothetical protein
MNISPETAIDHLRRWKTSSSPLSVAVRQEGLQVFSRATVRFVSAKRLVFGFSESGDGFSVEISGARSFQSFLPSEAAPSDVVGSHKACLLFLVITLQDGSLCKMCELSDRALFPVVLFSGIDNKVTAETG